MLTKYASRGGGTILYAGPDYDNYVGAGGADTFKGRLLSGPNALTWAVRLPSGNTNDHALGLDGSGNLSGSLSATGGSSNATIGYTTTPAMSAGRRWWKRRGNPLAAASPFTADKVKDLVSDNASHPGVNTVNTNFSAIITTLSSATSGALGNLTIRVALNQLGNYVTPSALATATTINHVFGDEVMIQQYTIASNVYWDVYFCGKMVLQSVDITATGVPITNLLGGVRGDTGASAFDYFEVGDPDTTAMIVLYTPTRVVQKKANGDVRLYFEGVYTLGAPPSLKYSLYNASTGVVLAAHNDQNLTIVSIGSNAFLGYCDVLAADWPAVGVSRVISRTDIIGGGRASSYGSPILAGRARLLTGQSLQVQAWTANSNGVTAAITANSWLVDASVSAAATELLARVFKPLTLTPNNDFFKAYNDAMGSAVAQSTLRGGTSGSTAVERAPTGYAGSNNITHAEELAGLRRVGRSISVVHERGGQAESSNVSWGTQGATYIAALEAKYNSFDAYCGAAVKVIIHPLNNLYDVGTDALADEIRYVQRGMARGLFGVTAGRYALGVPTSDIQHTSASDPYHLSSANYAVQYVRDGEHEAYVMDAVAAANLEGPFVDSVQKVDDQTIRVFVNPNGATAISADNTTGGVFGFVDYQCGFQFAQGASGAFTTRKYPNAIPTVGAISGGLYPVDFPFAAGTFTGISCDIRAHYGCEPFNQGGNAALGGNATKRDQIRINMQTDASMLRGTYASGKKIPIQPMFSDNGGVYAGSNYKNAA